MLNSSLGWPTGQLLIVFVVGFTSLVTDTSLKNFSVVQRAITKLSKLLYYIYHDKSHDVSKITLADQRIFVFHRDFRLSEFVDRQQSLGTNFLQRYSSLYVVQYLQMLIPDAGTSVTLHCEWVLLGERQDRASFRNRSTCASHVTMSEFILETN